MATFAPGTRVAIDPKERLKLRFPPPAGTDLVIGVHPAAMKAASNRLTVAATIGEGRLQWIGALDERMLIPTTDRASDPRPTIRSHLLVAADLWRVVRPGLLVTATTARPLYTVYDGDRPWIIVGETSSGSPTAVPLNDARGGAKWWTPTVSQADLEFAGAKTSHVELAHPWWHGRWTWKCLDRSPPSRKPRSLMRSRDTTRDCGALHRPLAHTGANTRCSVMSAARPIEHRLGRRSYEHSALTITWAASSTLSRVVSYSCRRMTGRAVPGARQISEGRPRSPASCSGLNGCTARGSVERLEKKIDGHARLEPIRSCIAWLRYPNHNSHSSIPRWRNLTNQQLPSAFRVSSNSKSSSTGYPISRTDQSPMRVFWSRHDSSDAARPYHT
jgi:hypothetical protein